MKYQNFAVIFVIIILPLSMVLSYYIQAQTETLTLESQYLNKLNDSTYDAVSAYQMNSLNTQRVTGESVKDYVLASVNTFFTTLATNMGMSSASKQYLLPYIPAILFTTYDGYYIYSPMKMEKIAEDLKTGVGLQTKDGDLIYISDTAPQNFRPSATDCEAIKDTEDGDAVSGNYTNKKTKARKEYKYMLKPFIYYSAQYRKNGSYDFVASYTLDNYVAVYGSANNITADSGISDDTTFSKSGYLIDPTKIELTGKILLKGITRNTNSEGVEVSASEQATYTEVIEANKGNRSIVTQNNVRYKTIDLTSEASEAYKYINYYNYGEENTFSYDGKTYYPSRVTTLMTSPIRYQTGDDIIETTLDIEEYIGDDSGKRNDVNSYLLINSGYDPITVKYNEVEITDRQAKEYYIKAFFFSEWVENNLSDVKASSIVQNEEKLTTYRDGDRVVSGEVRDEYIDFEGDDTEIFKIKNNPNNDPENTNSPMSEHKRSVIKNSIQFNLNTAISTYNETYFGTATNEEFKLPILRTDDWENILNNVSMTTFMQGMPCGLTTFNNYTVVKSNNNNTSASLENIYFTDMIGTKNRREEYPHYHKYDCPRLSDGATESEMRGYYLSDLSAEFKYDAKKINVRIKSPTESDTVVCLFDDSTNTYYTIDEEKTTSINVLAVGEQIPNNKIRSYYGQTYKPNISSGQWEEGGFISTDLTSLPNSSDVLYLYDHQNLGCYECIVSGQYEPIVKFYDGELRRIYTTSDGENVIAIESSPGNISKAYYPDGREYTGNTSGGEFECSVPEWNLRKKSIYTAIARHRNMLYKTNDYVNR